MQHSVTDPGTAPSHSGVVHVTIVHAPACHFCADADTILSELAADHPQLVLTRLDLRTLEGQQLAQQHRAAMSPLVLLDGQFFSQGRLPRGQVRRLRSRLAAQTGVRP